MLDQLKCRLRDMSHSMTFRGRVASSILSFWGKALEFRRDVDPLAWLARTLSSKLVLIFGCQRSGTTLLYMLLTSHPGITGKDDRVKLKDYPWEGFDPDKLDEVKLGASIWKYKKWRLKNIKVPV